METINKLIIAGIFLSMMFVLTFIAPDTTQAQYYLGLCTPHNYQNCVGNNLYWYDSCGNQQELTQYCQNGCYNNSCQDYNNNNYNNYNNCPSHAYKLCVGNNVYWYDGCNNQQDLYISCYGGQVCNSPYLYGRCTTYIQPVQPQNNYVVHYRTACYGDSLYWYDSLGTASGLYKNCEDTNSCTSDICSGNKCSNTIKCDGSTCPAGSADYNTYCVTTPANNQCGNGLCEPNIGETTANCLSDYKIDTVGGLSITFFTKQDSNSNQWQKMTQIGSNANIYFMVTVANTSITQIDNVNISANIPMEISSLGNLQLDGTSVSGDIVSGINIGSLSTASTKSITFEGKTQTISGTEVTKQAIVTSSVLGVTQSSDSISINLNPVQGQVAAAVSSAPTTTNLWEFLKRWYLWILGALVLIFLLVTVFRRLSSHD